MAKNIDNLKGEKQKQKMNVDTILPFLQLILSISNICVIGYAFIKFLGKPHNSLEARVAVLEAKQKEHEVRLDKDSERLKEQDDTNDRTKVEVIKPISKEDLDGLGAGTDGFYVTPEEDDGIPASDIDYDNAASDLSATKVQGAIDELAKPAFTEASTRANIASGEKISTLFGKIKKWFTDLKAVAFSGSYNDLSDKPTIPAAQVNSDWNATSGVAKINNKPSLATVATSGNAQDISYSNTTSGLSATKAQNAIDELAKEKVDKIGNSLFKLETGQSTYAYARILRIHTTYQYIGNYPLIVEISGRVMPHVLISIIFESTYTTEPSIVSFKIDKIYPAYLVKTDTSTWDLIVPYNSDEIGYNWQSIFVHSIGGCFATMYPNLIDTTVNGNLDSLPSGTVVKANPIWTAGQVTISYNSTGSFKTVNGPSDMSALGFVSRVSGSTNCDFRIYPSSPGTWYINAVGLQSGETVTVNYAIYCP